MNKTKKDIITVSKSAHGTADIVVYSDRSSGVFDWFKNLDVWGSYGYDRFNDGGRYFEIPMSIAKVLKDIPAIRRKGFTVEYEGDLSNWI